MPTGVTYRNGVPVAGTADPRPAATAGGCGGCRKPCPPRQLLPGLADPLSGCWRAAGPWVLDPAEVARHDQAARSLAAGPMPEPPPMAGRGVVTCGGGKYWPGVVVMVRMLREVAGPDLPVQVWYRGTCEAVNAADVAGLGVELIDADALAARLGDNRVPRGRSDVGGWESKSYALTHTGFEDVIFIDGDAYFTADPSPLFDLAAAHGLVPWAEHGTDNIRWPFVGFPAGRPADAPASIQGGQFAISRRRAWRLLVLWHWLNQHSDYYFANKGGDPHGPGRHLFGDQDALRLASLLTGVRPHVVGHAQFHAGWGYSFQLAGRLVIEHCCFRKLIPAGLPGEARAMRHYADYLAGRAFR